MAVSTPIDMTFYIGRDKTDIVVSYPDRRGPDEFFNRDIHEDLMKALDYFCQKFYPNIYEERRPWHKHWIWKKEIPQLEKQLGLLNPKDSTDGVQENIRDLTTQIANLRRDVEETVKKELSQWPLAWYWKALFGAFPKFADKGMFPDKEVTIQVSQIRQWTLVLVYETTTKGKNLLRPPLFGRSERITNFDIYMTLLNFSSQIESAWNRILKEAEEGNIEGHNLDEELAYVIGRHDLFYRFNPSNDIKPADNNNDKLFRFEMKVSIDLEPHIKKYDLNDISDKMAKTALRKVIGIKTNQYKQYPYDVVFIPTFDKHDEKEEEILLASDHVCQAYEELSEIWNDKTTKSVLIIAPSGSGKEILSRSIYQFQNFNDGKLVSYALSPSSDELNYRMLYTLNLKDAKEVASLLGKDKASKELLAWINQAEELILNGSEKGKIKHAPIYEGLLFKARKGVLFLDEIDKVSDHTRSSLLRMVENSEFAVYETAAIVKFKEWRPLYVFAGSMSKKEMFSFEPPDFWTRISHTVEMLHPLSVDDELEARRITRSYFWFFWQQRLLLFCVKSGLLPFLYDKRQPKLKEFFEGYYADLFDTLSDRSVVWALSSMFAESVSEGGKLNTFSIRNIRAVAGRVRYGLIDYLLYDKRSNSALARIRNKVTKDQEIKTTEDEELKWFKALRMIISGQDKIKGLSHKDCEELRNEIRIIISSAIRKSLL